MYKAMGMKRLVNIGNLLTLRYDPFPDPLAKDSGSIRNIPPKEILESRQISTDYHNNIPSSQDLENEIGQIIRTKVEESNARSIAVALSSGVDSSVIFSLIRKEFPSINIECINVTFDEDSSEARDAEGIAKSKDAGFHEIHIGNPLKDLPKLLSIIQEPRWNVYQYYFIESAKSYSNVLFTGDGGDELFAGYTFRYKKFIQKINSLNRSSWDDRVITYLSCHERDWVPDQSQMFAGTEVKFSWPRIYEIMRKYFDNDLDPIEQVLLADYHGKLMYDFVPTNEKFFKHFDIVGIAPLLHKEIINLSTKIPASVKYDFENNIGKIQLREIIKRNMTGYSDEKGRKIGFGMDLARLWSSSAKEIVISSLDKARIFEDKIINKEWYNKSLSRIRESNNDENEKGKAHTSTRYISKMLQILSLEIWYKLFITSEIKAHSSL